MRSFLGQQLGNYRLEKEIARGGFGTVYLAQHTLLTDRLVAIKVLHDVLLNAAEERKAFLQEARLLEQLKHPFILPLLDVGIQEQIPFLITEYAAQGSLRSRLNARLPHPLPVDESLTLLSQIGQALQYAHQQTPAIIHRDLKPDNILLNAHGEALLADFGIATLLSTASVRLTSTTGTPAYMAPEQFRGQVSRETDQYALGCIAYELFTGRKPFTAPDFVAMGFKHATEEPILPTQLNPDLPPHVEDAVLKAMAKQREDRHADVVSFVTALRRSSAPQREQGQEETIEKLDPKAVWARIRRKNIPTTWHVVEMPSGRHAIRGYLAGGVWGFFASVGLVALGVDPLYAAMSGISLSSFVPADYPVLNLLTTGIMLCGMLCGTLLGGAWGRTSGVNTLVLMPDGLIHFAGEDSYTIIGYKMIKHIRFDSPSDGKHKGVLVFDPLPRTGNPEIDRLHYDGSFGIDGYNEAPHLIARRVQDDYTRFQARNHLP